MNAELLDLPEIDNYQELFTSDIPLIDVRAPIEFNTGAFPFAFNHPLMSDEERHLIGICYKKHGQRKANRKHGNHRAGTSVRKNFAP